MNKVSLMITALMGLGILSETSHAQSATTHLASVINTAQRARGVKYQVLTSTEMPTIRLKFGKKFKYVGNHSFILYDVARAEQHFFVEADAQGRVKRLYWVQFEGYLPNNKETYDYKVNKIVRLGGLDFIADAYARNIKANPGRPDSYGSRARAFLANFGFAEQRLALEALGAAVRANGANWRLDMHVPGYVEPLTVYSDCLQTYYTLTLAYHPPREVAAAGANAS